MDGELLTFWIDQLKELLPDPCEDEIDIDSTESGHDKYL